VVIDIGLKTRQIVIEVDILLPVFSKKVSPVEGSTNDVSNIDT